MEIKREPALDGLRALAVLMVVGVHTGIKGLGGGGLGVDVFFVLSGYLITSILLTDPPLIDFLERRARRLMPALAGVVLAYLAAAPLLDPKYFGHAWVCALAALTYSTNYTFPPILYFNALDHTWSLAVEMQFYLLWPFGVRALRKARPSVAAGIFLGLWAAIWFVRVATFYAKGADAAYFPLHTHASGLVVGAALAFFPALRRCIAPLGWLGLLGICALSFLIPNGTNSRPFELVFGITAAELCAAALICGLLQPGRLASTFAWAPVRWIGEISYGIYLWHFPIAMALFYGTDAIAPVWRAPTTITFAICLAALSHVTVERWGRSAFRWRSAPPISGARGHKGKNLTRQRSYRLRGTLAKM